MTHSETVQSDRAVGPFAVRAHARARSRARLPAGRHGRGGDNDDSRDLDQVSVAEPPSWLRPVTSPA